MSTVRHRELSDRQAEVLRLTRAGIPVRQIAAVLGISTQRVHQHLARLRALGELRDEEASA